MPYLRTYDFPGKFIDAQHAALVTARRSTRRRFIDIGIEGKLSVADALKLYELAYFCDGDVLDLGTFYGLSALLMLRAMEAAGRPGILVSVEFKSERIAKVRTSHAEEPGYARLHLWHGEAVSTARHLINLRRQFGLIFVDLSYRLHDVIGICRHLASLLPAGAFVLFHDFNDPRNAERTFGVYQGTLCGLDRRLFEFWGIYGCSALFRRITFPAPA